MLLNHPSDNFTPLANIQRTSQSETNAMENAIFKNYQLVG